MDENIIYFVTAKECTGIKTHRIYSFIIKATDNNNAELRARSHLQALDGSIDFEFVVIKVSFDANGVIFRRVEEK